MSTRVRLAATFGYLCLSGIADAHHSFGTFDLNRSVEIVGTIDGIDFVNPHSWLRIDSRNADGAAVTYRCEMRGATVLRRSGWTPEMFVAGEPITVQGAPDRLDPLACYVNTVVMADGKTLDRYTQREEEAQSVAAPTTFARTAKGVPNLAGDWAVEQQLMTDPRGRSGALVPKSVANEFEPGAAPELGLALPGGEGFGPMLLVTLFYRLSVGAISPRILPWLDQPIRLTARGVAATPPPDKQPQFQCQPTSIIVNWYLETLVNRITQDDDVVTIEYGQPGLKRTVHLDAVHPAVIEPSRVGHSIGHWEGDVLVVDTVGFSPGMLGTEFAHGERLHVVERFALNDSGTVLTREYTATDPEYFIGEYRGTDVTPRSPVPFVEDTCNAELNPLVL